MNPVHGMERIKKVNPWHIALGVFLIGLTLFLAVRASDPYRWSNWGFGDAQSMLSLRQWEEGGWLDNYFLFIPQGYAKVIQFFDDPNLRQHAHGTCPGSSPVGPRLWYTHYPAGYLIPYAVFFRLGLDSLFSARMLSIGMSILALVLMYMVTAKITSRPVAFFAVLFYGLSSTFLGYADTIANQPIDDLLRFAFMYAIILSTRADTPSLRWRWSIAAWVFQFMLSLASFDSVFFLFVWVIGWDFLDGRGFRWKRYLVYSVAPLSAHSLQFFQNVWYLGFDDAVTDIMGTFLRKNAADAEYNVISAAGEDRLSVMKNGLLTLLENLYSPWTFIAGLAGFYLIYSLYFLEKGERELPSVKLLLVLLLCGCAFVVVLPHAARMPYEARQMIPFASLLVGGLTWSFFREFGRSLHGHPESPEEEESKLRKWGRPFYLLLSAALLLVFWYLFSLNDRSPVYYIPDAETDARYAGEIETLKRYDLLRYRELRAEVLLAEELKKMPTAFEPVFFSLGGFQLFWDPKYVPGYPQIMPITEYYTGSKPILCFNAPEGVVKDLIYMINGSPVRFSPILISDNPAAVDQVIGILGQEGVLTAVPQTNYFIMERYIVDLTDYVRWGK